MKIAIYGQAFYPDSSKYLKQIINVFRTRNIDFRFQKQYLQLIKENEFLPDVEQYKTFEKLDNSYDFFFSLGGDGTILSSIKFVSEFNIPIVGINTGRLGFLATIHKDEVSPNIIDILDGKCSISERTLLEVDCSCENFNIDDYVYALNEVAIGRKDTTSMITVDTWIDDEHVGAYWSDGLIISTPTGSTGYSLSCGGPIISPRTEALVLTPIAPHNLNARPLVISDQSEIRLKVLSRENRYLMSMDSRIYTLPVECEVNIRKASFKVKLVSYKGNSFLKTLRTKLLWGQDQRN